MEYLGIAADEPKRFGQLSERKRAPLVEFGIEEGLCGLYCQYEGILAPSYETSCRDGCWMCHNQGVNQLRQLRKNYPDLWAWRKQRKGMLVGEAYSIFHNIDDPNITDEEKGLAIWKVASMETHNSVTKAAMVKVIRYLLGLCFEPPEG